MSWHLAAHHVARKTTDYEFGLDVYARDNGDQMVFVGLHVYKWTAQTLKEMMRVFKQFRSVVKCPLYVIGLEDDEKWAGFVKLFGFKFHQYIVCENGEQRRLFINLPTLPKDKKNNDRQHEGSLPVSVVSDEPVGTAGGLPHPSVPGRI